MIKDEGNISYYNKGSVVENIKVLYDDQIYKIDDRAKLILAWIKYIMRNTFNYRSTVIWFLLMKLCQQNYF